MGNTAPQSADNLTFVYDYDFGVPPDYGNSANLHFAEVNAFYIVNTLHDITYRYGFTENSYNFQDDNFGRGGDLGADRVMVSVQDSNGSNNANFATPPDGQNPLMRLFPFIVYNVSQPQRDPAIENDLIVHEVRPSVMTVNQNEC